MGFRLEPSRDKLLREACSEGASMEDDEEMQERGASGEAAFGRLINAFHNRVEADDLHAAHDESVR
jgi:hypothetical protein